MNWPFKNIFKVNSPVETDNTVTLYNGTLKDKKDIEDPTEKFGGPVHIGTAFKRQLNRNNVSYQKPEYDLETLANAIQLDGILNRSVSIYVEQILKNGFEFNSENDKIYKHISRRIKEIQNFTGITYNEFIYQVAYQLVAYGNAYVIKVKKDNMSKLGKQYRFYGKNTNPIVGLFVADATTIEVGIDPNGNVTTYKQEINGRMSEWDEREVIHLTYNKIPGTLLGRSHIHSVLDDVRALRKLEEEIEILGFQYSIPLYLYKVGNKEIPAAPGEIDKVSEAVANMPSYGMLVVPGHHSIEIPSNANSMDIIKYVDHFKKRIFAGLGISPILMGESSSSNRNTAQVADIAMQTITKLYQQIIKNKIEQELFKEFLLDGGFNKIDDYCELKFPEIDIESQIKKENHIISKWQNNLIGRKEARNEMDYEINVKEDDTFLNLIDIPKIQAQGAIQLQIARSKNVASSTSKASKTTSNKVAPANQHGKSTRPKYTKDNIFDGLNFINKDSFSDELQKNIRLQIEDQLNYTINKIRQFYHIEDLELDNSIKEKYFSAVELIMEDKISKAVKISDDIDKLDLHNYHTQKFLTDQEEKINNLAKILIYKSLGFESILLLSDNCVKHSSAEIQIDNIDYSKIPPFEYGCKCEISEEKF